jgi:glycine cleavage system aminomethyltransferase T
LTHLDFLSPDRAIATDGFRPLAKSSMERRQRDGGARFEERHGWLLPASFPGEADRLGTVGVADLSHLAKFEVRGPGEPIGGEGVVWYQQMPERAFVFCPHALTGWVRDRLERDFSYVLDQTGALSILALVGPQAPILLRRLTHLHHFPASGDVAHIGAHVLEQDGGFWIAFLQEYGHYLWEVAIDAAGSLGGGPIGVDALARSAA